MSKKKWNVLVFPGGNENGLEIWKSLKDAKEVELFSAANDVSNHAPFVYKKHTIIPGIDQVEWLDGLNILIQKEKIDFIFPAHSLIIDALQKNRSKIQCRILMPANEVIEQTRSKKKTLKVLEGVVPIPKMFENIHDIVEFPIFVKPVSGFGAQGTTVIETQIQLLDFIERNNNIEDFLFQELLPGREYTIDCFSDSQGKVLFSAGRERQRVRMGTSMHSYIVDKDLNRIFSEYAEKIVSRIQITGAWFFQMKENNKGELKLLEIDTRIAGTMGLNRVRGINFPLLSLYDAIGIPLTVMTNRARIRIDRALQNRYEHDIVYNSIYVDLDDTLIIKDQVNTDLLKFLYQSFNEGKQIILLSKSLAEDKDKFLKKYRISEIFDRKIWLHEQDSKAEYIKEKNAIFIDDSFTQRLEVMKKCNIPTFDCSMIEMLMEG